MITVDLLLGRYRYVRELGQGSSGRVVEVVDEATEGMPRRALKAVDGRAWARLRLERDALASLAHPNLVAVHELLVLTEGVAPPFGWPRGSALLVEDLAPGDDGAQALLGVRGRDRVHAALAAAQDVALALTALHAAGLLHGDVKPANTRIDGDGHATLLDLGLAGPGGAGGPVRGTLPFLAPEGLAGTRSVGTDLYALGVSLHRWLGGELPAPGSTPVPSSDLPEPVRMLVRDLTRADPAGRPLSARATATRLADAARATGLTLPRPALEPTPRERALAARALPYVEPHEGMVDGLVARLRAGGVVEVVGPPGSGRTRLIQEAAARLQTELARDGFPPRTFATVGLSREPSATSAVLHIVSPPAGLADRWAQEARIGRVERTIVVERSGEGGDVQIGPLDGAPFERLLAALVGPEPSTTLRRAALASSGGLAGRLVRAVEGSWAEGMDPALAETLSALGQSASEPLAPLAREAAVRLALLGGRGPVSALEPIADGLARLIRLGDARLAEGGLIVLRADHARRLVESGTAKRRAAVARSLTPYDDRSAAYLAAHRGEGTAASFLGLAEVAYGAGRGADAERLLEDAASLYDADESVRRALFEVRLSMARYDAAASAAPSPGERAEALRRAGHTEAAEALLADQPADCAPATRGWLALARGRLADVESFAEAATAAAAAELRAWVALGGEHPAEAERLVTEALRDAPPRAAARLESTRGAARHRTGALAAARDSHVASLAAARALGERHLEAAALGNLGAVQLELGELGPALTHLEEAARRLALLGRGRDVLRALANLASAALVLGDLPAAEGWLTEARRSAADSDPIAEAHLHGLDAELALRRGDLPEANRAALAAVAVPGAGVRWEPRMVTLLARHHPAWATRWRGDPRDASAFDGAMAVFRAAMAVGAREDAREAFALLDPRSWAEALERSFAALELAEEVADDEAVRRAATEARALLDAGARTLDPARRSRLRASPRHQRVSSLASAEDPAARGKSSPDDRWRRLGGLAKRLGTEPRPERLHGLLTQAALDLVDAERALLVGRSETGELVVHARAGLGADEGISGSVVTRTLATRAPVVSMDALTDEDLDSAASVHALALRSVLCVPLSQRAEVLYLDDRLRTGVFGDDDRRLVRDLADLGAIALASAERSLRESAVRRRLARAKQQLEVRVRDQERELDSLRRVRDSPLVAVSPAMQDVVALTRRVATADVPVLLCGESGTGKELLARHLHRTSPRAAGPFVAESCASLPDGLVESLLFGHEKGAFTGAREAREGLFRAADGGTLFLDEIGEMSAAAQAKILRVLQEGEVRPVGGTAAHPIDVRLVTATHRPLETWVREGRFREDLYYRVAVVRIEVPPLRERSTDIPELVRRFLSTHSETGVTLTDDALAALVAHPWPGNVRELENEVRRALALGADPIDRAALSPALQEFHDDPLDLKAQVATLEARLIRAALARTEGNRTHAAELLGVSRYGLQKMIKRLELE